MTNKQLYLGGLTLFILFLFSFLVFFPNLESKKTQESRTEKDSSNVAEPEQSLNQQMLYNSELSVPEAGDFKVKFTNGKAAWDNSLEQRGNATFGTNFAEVYTNEGYNFINDIYVNTRGSGVFAYVALYRYFADATVLSDFDFLDDRVEVDSISVSTNESPEGEYTIEVSYKTRKSDEPYSSQPTVPVNVSYQVTDHKLSRIN